MSTDPIDSGMIRQAFDHGVKNLEFHISSAEILSRDATTAMNIIGSAGLGALGYTAHLLEQDADIAVVIGVAAVSIHLLLVAWFLLNKCMQASEMSGAWNAAENMYHPGYSADEVLLAEIKSHSARESALRDRNTFIGYWLNNLRRWAFAAPAIFLAAWLASGAAVAWGNRYGWWALAGD